jgi:uncharacterized iron-regulated membrane protein
VIAVSAISMNLERPVVRPLVSVFSRLTPEPEDNPELQLAPKSGAGMLSRERIVELATAAGQKMKLNVAPGSVFHVAGSDLYSVAYFKPGNDDVNGGLGNVSTYWDATTGQQVGGTVPGRGTAGDIFLQAQYPLHSGRILGVPGRIMMSFMGVMVALLSVTGLAIWLKKLNARRSASRRAKVKRTMERAS